MSEGKKPWWLLGLVRKLEDDAVRAGDGNTVWYAGQLREILKDRTR
jgi:hypothetical protein